MRLKSASAQSSDAFAFSTSGTRTGSNGLPGRQPEPRLELRGVGLGLAQRRVRFGRRDADQHRARGDARAALHRRADHAAAGFGGDVGLLVGGERSGDAQEAIDRTRLSTCATWTADGRRLGRSGGARAFAAARGGEERRASAAAVNRRDRTLRIMTVVPRCRYECIRMRVRSVIARAARAGPVSAVSSVMRASASASSPVRQPVAQLHRGGAVQRRSAGCGTPRSARVPGRERAGVDRLLDPHDHLAAASRRRTRSGSSSG